jgi:hypothetical protein
VRDHMLKEGTRVAVQRDGGAPEPAVILSRFPSTKK